MACFHGSALATTGSLLVLGDSLSAAYGMPLEQGWVALLEQRLAVRCPGLAVVNASISGETSAGGVRRLPALLEQHRPRLVLIELGGNDGLRGQPLTALRSSLSTLITQSRAQGAEVVLVGMRIPPNYGRPYAEGFHALYQELAAEHEVALVPFFLVGVAGEEGMMQGDGIHPTAAAQPRLLDTLWPVLEPLLESSGCSARGAVSTPSAGPPAGASPAAGDP